MTDEDIIRNLAEKVDSLRIASRLKDSDMEAKAGISRKTLYNFRQGSTGISLKNFIKILRALGELDRLERLFPESDSFSPLAGKSAADQPKRVRDRDGSAGDFKWGDES